MRYTTIKQYELCKIILNGHLHSIWPVFHICPSVASCFFLIQSVIWNEINLVVKQPVFKYDQCAQVNFYRSNRSFQKRSCQIHLVPEGLADWLNVGNGNHAGLLGGGLEWSVCDEQLEGVRIGLQGGSGFITRVHLLLCTHVWFLPDVHSAVRPCFGSSRSNHFAGFFAASRPAPYLTALTACDVGWPSQVILV